VQEHGTVAIDALIVRGDQVKSALASLHAREPNRSVAVRGDKRVAYGAVSSVLDAARGAGYADVALVTVKAKE
jgi:biopolymer transport protein ExbD